MSVVRLNEVIEKMKLENLTPEIDTSGIKVRQPDINRPAIQMTGYFDLWRRHGSRLWASWNIPIWRK